MVLRNVFNRNSNGVKYLTEIGVRYIFRKLNTQIHPWTLSLALLEEIALVKTIPNLKTHTNHSNNSVVSWYNRINESDMLIFWIQCLFIYISKCFGGNVIRRSWKIKMDFHLVVRFEFSLLAIQVINSTFSVLFLFWILDFDTLYVQFRSFSSHLVFYVILLMRMNVLGSCHINAFVNGCRLVCNVM